MTHSRTGHEGKTGGSARICVCVLKRWSLPPRYDYLCVCTPVWSCVASHSQPVLCMQVNVCSWWLHLCLSRQGKRMTEPMTWRSSFTPAAVSQRVDQLFKSLLLFTLHLCPVDKHEIILLHLIHPSCFKLRLNFAISAEVTRGVHLHRDCA